MKSHECSEWVDLLTLVGTECAAALTPALERVNAFAHSGRIDRAGLRALRHEIEHARSAAMRGQQIGRIGSGRVRVHEEKTDVSTMLSDALQQRAGEFASKGIELRLQLSPMTVVSDVTIVFALITALLDWCRDHASGRVEITTEVRTWSSQGALAVSFAAASGESAAMRPTGGGATTQSLPWWLVETCANKLNLPLERHEGGGRVQVNIDFPKAVMSSDQLDTMLDASLDEAPSSLSSRPLAGSHLLVICARRDVRVEVREAVQSLGLMVDFVATVDEARDFCEGGIPHAIVFEAPLGGAAMLRLMSELTAAAPSLAFIEVVESGKPYQVNSIGGRDVSSIARPALRDALPAALTFELTRAD